MNKILYLANPYGFSQQQRTLLLPPIIQILESLGAEVWEPFERNNQVDISKQRWAYKVAQADVQDVKTCDGIFAIVNGTPPDEGVMIELGMAIALNKAIFLFRDDFRHCADSEEYPLNLMLFAGLPQTRWQDYYYTSVDEISSPQKALYQWLQGDEQGDSNRLERSQ
ncbi:MAG: nucleoside 2-deoxyribosyltransferase [Elainellaceae cyanobacterium]